MRLNKIRQEISNKYNMNIKIFIKGSSFICNFSTDGDDLSYPSNIIVIENSEIGPANVKDFVEIFEKRLKEKYPEFLL